MYIDNIYPLDKSSEAVSIPALAASLFINATTSLYPNIFLTNGTSLSPWTIPQVLLILSKTNHQAPFCLSKNAKRRAKTHRNTNKYMKFPNHRDYQYLPAIILPLYIKTM